MADIDVSSNENEASWEAESTSKSRESSGDNENNEESHGADEDAIISQLTKTATQGVRVLKILTIATILSFGAAVSYGTYRFLTRQERNKFLVNFRQHASAVKESATYHMEEIQAQMRQATLAITTSALERGETFPFVTVPFFEVTGMQMREESDLAYVYWAPVVKEGQESEWRDYTQDNFEHHFNISQQIYFDHTGEKHDRDITFPARIINIDRQGNVKGSASRPGPWEPLWQSSPPVLTRKYLNSDTRFDPNDKELRSATDSSGRLLMGNVFDIAPMVHELLSEKAHAAYHFGKENSPTIDTVGGSMSSHDGHNEDHDSSHDHRRLMKLGGQVPHTVVVQPIYSDIVLNNDTEVVGHLTGVLSFEHYVINLLPKNASDIMTILTNTCGQSFSYLLHGESIEYLGTGDRHDRRYTGEEVVAQLFDDETGTPPGPGYCIYSFHLYPTSSFEGQFSSRLPWVTTVLVATCFAALTGLFLLYDVFVFRRNYIMQRAVVKSNKIVSSLFPSNVRDRLFAEAANEERNRQQDTARKPARIRNFMGNVSVHEPAQEVNPMVSTDNFVEEVEKDDDIFYKTKPIADLFPETTIMFADIAGFTAWSSAREPAQVFILLETIYKAFDDVAKSRRVFKVETVGDCYVAVAGLLDPRKDHAVVMARFCVDCLHRMRALTKKLEIYLGPDTTELDMRMGLHSGPVTAGVLRGERSRFQLFGDTMNTASRMESTGIPGKIQISQQTANLLTVAGKGHWLSPRDEKVHAKGKGEMQTFWLATSKAVDASGKSDNGSSESAMEEREEPAEKIISAKTERLVRWNTEVMLSLLRKVVAARVTKEERDDTEKRDSDSDYFNDIGSRTVLEEVREIISLPTLNGESGAVDSESVRLGETVEAQLHGYISAIADMYREDNSFHNFEHASHVTMSVVKLLSRIVEPDVEAINSNLEEAMHNYTYGITSDPLTQFACVFSAMIHDVDHQGVPNTRLIVENPSLAAIYKNKSVAEQNSVDLAWTLLQDDAYAALRKMIYCSEEEHMRFRQLVVNSVMATDIMDKDLKTLRNARWETAFSKEVEESPKIASDRKATIVIEHLIQASDVSHTMQHWHIFRKWNQRLFFEMSYAYKAGRAENDPAETWYKGEIGFFDFYIIPLAKKLKDCGVFGVSSDEYLNYAQNNRDEWEKRGKEIVAQMIQEFNSSS